MPTPVFANWLNALSPTPWGTIGAGMFWNGFESGEKPAKRVCPVPRLEPFGTSKPAGEVYWGICNP